MKRIALSAWIFMLTSVAKPTSKPKAKDQTGTILKASTTTVADALIACVEVAAAAADLQLATKSDKFNVSASASNAAASSNSWLEEMWDYTTDCAVHDYRTMNATCTHAARADLRDPCAVQPPSSPDFYRKQYYSEGLVSPRDLRRTALIVDLMAPCLQRLAPGNLPGTRLPAMLHQTWQDDDVGEEEDFKKQMDGWSLDSDPWVHLVWTDVRLNRLMTAAAPWTMPFLRKMRPSNPVDKIDTMRYLLLFLFGGAYLDADQVRVNGDLVKLLRGLPARGLAGGADPAVIASVGQHPMLLQMLVWILSRAQHALWGGRHELTGPEGWRRSLHAYRACEDADAKSPQAAWPTVLFNQHQCGCWGAEIIKANSPEHQARNFIQEQGRGGSGQWGTLIDDVSGDRAGGLIWARDVPIRADSARLTAELHMGGTLVGFHRIGSEGKKLSSSLACVGLHRCSRIYGKGPQDWPGGVSLGTEEDKKAQKGSNSNRRMRRALR